MLKGKTIVLGVTGGIAVYKACDIVSRLKKLHADVHVIMTKSAAEFVSPLTFQSLSHNKVIVDMFEKVDRWEIEHISLAKKADLFLIAPATANIIGKIVNGIADDMLSTTVMATKSVVYIAPAMNTNMYDNIIVQNNINKLKQLGYRFIDTDEGRLACGDIGKGKFQQPEIVVENIIKYFSSNNDLKGKKILVTAGPTREMIDPVRFISNLSSGKMGYSIAKVAIERGADVTLISGPTSLNRPEGLKEYVSVISTNDMYEEVIKRYEDQDIVIKCAAVSDYRAEHIYDRKIKKQKQEKINLTLEKNIDILKTLGERKTKQILVGFAAETNDIMEYAQNKLKNKNLDYIVANDVTEEGAGFGTDTNKVKIISKDGTVTDIELASKIEVAHKILDTISFN